MYNMVCLYVCNVPEVDFLLVFEGTAFNDWMSNITISIIGICYRGTKW